jgi:hypothetical protein
MTSSQEILDFYFMENITYMGFEDNLVRIRGFRKKKPMEVVRGINVDKQQYYAWEAGTYKPSDENLDRLSSYFEVPRMLFFKESLTNNDLMELDKSNNDDDWYRQTIANLIHHNSEAIKANVEAIKVNNETIVEFRKRDESEILSLRIDKDKLLDFLTSHFKAPQNG